MATQQILNPPTVAPPVGPYANGIKVTGNTIIMVAGQIPLDEKGHVVGRGDVKEQTRRVMQNIQGVLAAGGATFDNVVKFNTYVTDIRMWQDVVAVRQEFMGGKQVPGTLVQVDNLGFPDFLVEIECMAVL